VQSLVRFSSFGRSASDSIEADLQKLSDRTEAAGQVADGAKDAADKVGDGAKDAADKIKGVFGGIGRERY